MTPEIKFNYPVYYESTYKFPIKYYLNVTIGHSIIKRDQLIISDPVKIGPDGIINSNEDNTPI